MSEPYVQKDGMETACGPYTNDGYVTVDANGKIHKVLYQVAPRLQDMVTEWHIERFPDATLEQVTIKAAEEMGEVAKAVNAFLGGNDVGGRSTDVAGGAADVVIVLMTLLGRYFPDTDLLVEVAKKLAILNDPYSGHRAALPL